MGQTTNPEEATIEFGKAAAQDANQKRTSQGMLIIGGSGAGGARAIVVDATDEKLEGSSPGRTKGGTGIIAELVGIVNT